METIRISGVAKPVSRLIKGTDYFFHDSYEKAAANMDAFLAIGGNTVDTAHIYCSGQSEEVLGRYMDERGCRDRIVILTKGAHHDKNGPRVNKEAIRHDLMTSLERLRTDYVELYALHRDDPNVPVGEIIEALNEHIESGRIGAIGGSNWTWQRLQEANDHAAAHGLIGFSFSSPNLSLAKANVPFWAGTSSSNCRFCRGRRRDNWGSKYPLIIRSWRNNWAEISTFFKYPPEIRKLIYTTNMIESYHRQLRKVTKGKSIFPSDEALLKMLYLATMDVIRKWTGRVQNWGQILLQLSVFFPDRI